MYDKAKKKMVNVPFLRLNINNEYNFGMGGVDIADQLRGSYRFDTWARKSKWWHSIFWWAFQVLMVNSYKCYIVYMQGLGLKTISHYEFQKAIALDWISGGHETTRDSSRSDTSTTSSISTNGFTASTNQSLRPRFSNTSLHPLTGALKCRLNKSVGHYPVESKRQNYCQLHRWAFSDGGGNRNRKYHGVITCNECNVNLCAGYCYEAFHEVWELDKKKQHVQKILTEISDHKSAK